MLFFALILLIVGAPLQLSYCVRMIITKGRATPRWYYAALLGGLCNVLAGLLLRDPLLVSGQVIIICIYSLTRPKPAKMASGNLPAQDRANGKNVQQQVKK